MRHTSIAVVALLAIGWLACRGYAQDAAAKGDPRPPSGKAVALDRGELDKRSRERARAMQAERLKRTRAALVVQSDEKWAKMSPAIAKLDQLRRLRHASRREGTMLMTFVQGRGGKNAATDPARITQRIALSLPDLKEDDFKVLLAARIALAKVGAKPDATEEEINKALADHRAALAQLELKIAPANDLLASLATPRQQARLVLMGILE